MHRWSPLLCAALHASSPPCAYLRRSALLCTTALSRRSALLQIIASALDTEAELLQKYSHGNGEIEQRLAQLRARGVVFKLGVDATKVELHHLVSPPHDDGWQGWRPPVAAAGAGEPLDSDDEEATGTVTSTLNPTAHTAPTAATDALPRFDRVVYNFPYAHVTKFSKVTLTLTPTLTRTQTRTRTRTRTQTRTLTLSLSLTLTLNQDFKEKQLALLRSFFARSAVMLAEGGEVHVRNKTSQPYCGWDLKALLPPTLVAVGDAPFDAARFPGYSNKSNWGGAARDYTVGSSRTFVFRLAAAAGGQAGGLSPPVISHSVLSSVLSHPEISHRGSSGERRARLAKSAGSTRSVGVGVAAGARACARRRRRTWWMQEWWSSAVM